MASQSKLLPLISELGKLTLNAPTLTNIDTLTPVDGSYPQQLRLVYVQQHYKESMPLKNSIYLTFDPSKTPALTSFPSFSSVENDVQADSYSPSRQFRALFRKSGDKTVLEIWSKTGLWKSLRISDLHGTIYADPIFCMGSAAIWSQDEKRIVYIAEKKDDPITKYYDGLDTDDQATKTLNKFTYKQELGEGYPGRKTPLVFIYDIEEGTLHQVLNIPKDVIATCVNFADSEGKSIIFSGFTFKEFKLGMKFCSNRPSQIFHAKKLVLEKMGKPKKPEEKKNGEPKAEEKKEDAGEKKEGAEAKKEEVDEKKQREQEAEQNMAVKLNDDPISTCPAINSDFSKVIYYFSPWKHTHAMSFGLKILNLKEGAEKKEELIVDIVQEKRKAEEFPGITGFTDILVKTSWIGDDYVVFNTYRGCSLAIYLLNVKTKEIRRLDQGKYKTDEWRVRAVFGDTIVSTVSNPDGASKFGIYHGLNLKGANLAEVVKDAKWHYYDLQFKGLDGSVQNKFDEKGEIDERIIDVDGVESMFFAAKEAKDAEGKVIPYNQRPMMVFLHGGPHGVYTGAFTVMRHYLQAHGYNVLYPCFTGSMGYGQKFLEDLAGKIGEIDIKEILQAIQYCIKEGLCDGNSVGILGGSYGGYLSGVLLAKHSEMFKCAVIINPAINVLHLWETSDIPEWGPSEALNKDTVFDINADEIKKMYEMSPISMYKGVDVKSSILLVVGEKDRRVPWGGAFQYYKMLKTKGADVRMINYPEGDHSLVGNPEVEFDLLIQTVKFVNEKLGKENAQDKPQA